MVSTHANLNDAKVESKRSERDCDERCYRPHIDLFETADEWTLVAEMPGVGADGFDVSIDNQTLVIHGRARPRQSDDTRYIFREYGVGDYRALFTLADDVDTQRISAEYADGELTLHLPRAEAAKPRTIEVRSAS